VILAGMDSLTLVLGRFVVASVLFGLTAALTPLAKAKPGQRPMDRRGLLIGFAAGGINGLTLAILFKALTYLHASISSLLSLALIPIFTLILLFWRGEAIRRRDLLRLAASLLGLYLLVGLQGTVNPWGLFLVVSGAFLFSVHIVAVQWYLKPYNTWAVTALLVISATVAVIVLWLIEGSPTYVPGWGGWLAIAVQGVLVTYIARLLTYQAINYIGSGQYALLSPLETALTVLWAFLFLGEWIDSWQWLGMLLILVSPLFAFQALRVPSLLRRSRRPTTAD
jgi:drug/metabolite transporter (DMT)-like permease